MQLHRLLWMDRLAGSIRQFGPYAALELALPGGSLIALALWAARHHPMATVCWRRVLALMLAVVAAFATAQPAFGNLGNDSVALKHPDCGADGLDLSGCDVHQRISIAARPIRSST
jgi:hypothetical protein